MEENGKIYRFWIRDDVRWQDGRPLSTEDIVFTLSLLTIPRIKKGPFMEDINYTLMRVDKISNNGVRIVLRNPNAYFLEHLVELPVLPSHVFYRGISKRSHGSLNPIGTGPYRMLEWMEDDKIILERNEFYWGQTPQIQRLVFKEIKSPAKTLVEIRRKKLDLLPKLSPVHYPSQITSNIKKDYKLYKFVPPDFSYLLWNTRNRMISDFRIRRAFSMLINRELIIKKVYRNLAVSCNGDGIRDKNNKKLKLVILLPLGNPRARQLLKIIKTQFFKAGIEVLIVPTAWKLLSRHLKQRKFAAAFLTWKGRPYEDFSPIFHSAGKNNYGVVYNIFIDRLITRMRQQKSFENLLEYSKKLEKMLHSYLPITFLFRPVEISLVHRRFSNVIPTSFGFKYKEFKTKTNKNK
jgi:peptide/nickel transport system substrate-binding protein